jgi:hypothetical protein
MRLVVKLSLIWGSLQLESQVFAGEAGGNL